MKLQNFTYRKQREKKPEPPAGVYEATIYSITEWTKNEETSLFVNVAIGTEYSHGINFRLFAEKETTREYAERKFSSLLDVCGIDGESFDGETDVLLGKKFIVVLEAGTPRPEEKGFFKLGSIQVDEPPAVLHSVEPQESQFNYDKRPGFIDTVDNSNDEPPF